jgi:hypothetical protein
MDERCVEQMDRYAASVDFRDSPWPSIAMKDV